MWFINPIANGFSTALRSEYFSLKDALANYHASLPPFSDTRGIKPYEAVSIFNPHILLAHTTHHGSVLLLHGLMAGEDAEARAKVMESAKALADICSRIRGERGIRRVQGFLVPVVSFACSISFTSPRHFVFPDTLLTCTFPPTSLTATYDECVSRLRTRTEAQGDPYE